MLSSSEKYELKKKFRHLESQICKIDTALDSKADLVDGVVPTEQLPITQDIIDALNNANAPTGINYFTTLADLSSITPGTLINVAANYSALPAANTVPGEFYWVENSQGTSWLPGPLGGTYYSNGLYYSNGVNWIYTDVPYNASQTEVDAGLNNNRFITPMTFNNASKWTTKQDNVTLTTTGTSGAATLVGSTLNIPQYQSVLTNPVTGTGTAGQVSYWSGTGTQTGSSNLTYDNTLRQLKVTGGTANYILDLTTTSNSVAFRFEENSVLCAALQYIGSTFSIANRRQYLELIGTNGIVFRSTGSELGRFNGGNFLLNSTTDNGQRLQVIGSTLLRGSGTTSSTTALLVQNSTPSALLTVTDDGATLSQATFAPTSGTAIFTNYRINPTINQTGGANGITRGLYVNPTLTAAADWRSIEWSNNTGWGLYGAGTAANYLAGNTSIGTTTSSGRLTVQGSGTTSSTKALVVNNSTPTAIFEILDNGRISQTIPGASTNTLFGTDAGANSSLSNNNHTAFGRQALFSTTTAANCTAIGREAAYNGDIGDTTAVGYRALYANISGFGNTAIGTAALAAVTSGNNVGVGRNAGSSLTASTNNLILGYNAGRFIIDGVTALTVANNSVFLGFDTRAAADSQTNQIVIGYQAIGNGSNTATLGNTSITNTYLRGNINYTDGGNFVIGTTTGTKIGTATSQKIGFWNATPIVQPTTGVAAATRVGGGGTTVTDSDTFDGYTIAQLVKALRNMGALA